MHVHSTFQIKTFFNNVLFSTEVHNPLACAPFGTKSYITLNFYPVSVCVTVLTSFLGNDPYLAYTVSIYVLPLITESVSVTVLAIFFYGPYIYYICRGVGMGSWGKQVGSMDEEPQVRGCYNITFICTPTNQETVSVLEKTQANKTFRTWKQM